MKHKDTDIPPCPDCGTRFKNSFELADHLIDEDEEVFNPGLLLPNGYHLMIGSLLRYFYHYADSPESVKSTADTTYYALWLAETSPDLVDKTIEEIIVSAAVRDIDKNLKSLLENGQ